MSLSRDVIIIMLSARTYLGMLEQNSMNCQLSSLPPHHQPRCRMQKQNEGRLEIGSSRQETKEAEAGSEGKKEGLNRESRVEDII